MFTEKILFKRYILKGAILTSFLFLASSVWALHETLLKGSIIGMEDGMVYVCVGSDDGAKIGEKMDVYRVRFETSDNVAPRLKNVSKRIQRDKIGQIEITKVIDEHFSEAKVISGKVEIHDIVELK